MATYPPLRAALHRLKGSYAARFAGEVQKRDEELKSLRGQLDDLQKTVRTQQMTIEGLASRVNRYEE